MRFARTVLAVALMALAGCGGGGGSDGGGDLLPIGTGKSYSVPSVSGPGFAGADYTVVVRKQLRSAGRQSSPSEVTVLLTSSDGLFVNTPVQVSVLTENHLEGTVVAGGQTYAVAIDFDPTGNSIQFSISLGGNTATGTGTVTATGGGSSTADPALMGAARDQFTSLLDGTAQGNQISLSQLQQAETAWRAAYQSGPLDPQAAFGYAMTHIAATAAGVIERLGLDAGDSISARDRQAGFILGAASRMYNPAGAVAAVAAAPTGAAAPALEPFAIVAGDLSLGRPKPRTRQSDTINEEQWETELLTVLLPAVEEARVAMDVAATSASFSYQVTLNDSNGDSFTLTFGQQDAQLLSAVINIISGAANLAAVYETGDLDSVDSWEYVRMPESVVADGQLTPDEYTWPRPLGVRAADGATRGQTAMVRLRTATNNLVSAWNAINASNTLAGQSLDELFGVARRSRQLDAQSRGDITRALAELQEIFAGPYAIDYAYLEEVLGEPLPDDLKQNVTGIDLPAFWNNPPADLRDLLPTLEILRRNVFSAEYTAYAILAGETDGVRHGDWPDSAGMVTLGGLLSPGVAESAVMRLAPIDGLALSAWDRSTAQPVPGYIDFNLDDASWVSEDFLPWSGARAFSVEDTWGGQGTITVTVVDNGDGVSRATAFHEVQAFITTSDGVLNNAPIAVDFAEGAYGQIIFASVGGTAVDSGGRIVRVGVWFHSDSVAGDSVTVNVSTSTEPYSPLYGGQAPITF